MRSRGERPLVSTRSAANLPSIEASAETIDICAQGSDLLGCRRPGVGPDQGYGKEQTECEEAEPSRYSDRIGLGVTAIGGDLPGKRAEDESEGKAGGEKYREDYESEVIEPGHAAGT